jgi:dTDP-glucose pyrophosphorylase
MKVIVPCCGRSTRYPMDVPKWMLPAHNGQPMLAMALEGIAVPREDIVVTILQEHEDRHEVTRGLEKALGAVRVVRLSEPTRSQAETVARTLEALALDEPFLIKDSDNTFALTEVGQDCNFVCVDSLNNHDLINPRNKSYVQVDHQDIITNIREKVVVSDLFSVGGYFFTSPPAFRAHYERLMGNRAPWQGECYISDVIGSMILEGTPFKARRISRYQDWGTVQDWRRALLTRKTYFVLLDGFLFERGSHFFRPHFSEVRPQAESVAVVKGLLEQGHTVRYLSIRPRELATLTETQIREAGLPPAEVMYECPVSAWVLLTAPHQTLPFQTSRALELAPDDPHLEPKLRGEA